MRCHTPPGIPGVAGEEYAGMIPLIAGRDDHLIGVARIHRQTANRIATPIGGQMAVQHDPVKTTIVAAIESAHVNIAIIPAGIGRTSHDILYITTASDAAGDPLSVVGHRIPFFR